MRVLVMGGTVFLGRAVVEQAQVLGAEVTLFHRGRSGSAPEGVESVLGDRTVATDLDRLTGREFDVVVDTSGYVPADVSAAADRLAGTCGRYAFVSTINVFPGWPSAPDYHTDGVHSGDPDARREDVPAELTEAGPYGWLKTGCEAGVRRAFGADRTTVLRAGCIVGPHDTVAGRLPWWIARAARGGDILVPGRPGDPVSLIDARDLARFALGGPAGVFETGGPHRDTRAELMAAALAATAPARAAAGLGDPRLHYVEDEWLAAQGVESWTEVPLWVPAAEGPSVFAHDGAAAAAAGLTWRPLRDTVADTWAWQQSVPGGWAPTASTPGLAPDREAELLRDYYQVRS